MEKINCVLIEDDVLELLSEIKEQMEKKLVCCKCKNPCEGNAKCAMAMKNLLTDIHLFTDAYIQHNKLDLLEEIEETKEVVIPEKASFQ